MTVYVVEYQIESTGANDWVLGGVFVSAFEAQESLQAETRSAAARIFACEVGRPFSAAAARYKKYRYVRAENRWEMA